MQQPQLFNILNDHYKVSEQLYEDALQTSRDKGESIGEVLVDRRILTENQLLEALSRLYDVPFWPELPLDNIDFEFTRHIPIQFLKKYSMVPLVIKALPTGPEEGTATDAHSTTDDLPDFLRYIVAMSQKLKQELQNLKKIPPA